MATGSTGSGVVGPCRIRNTGRAIWKEDCEGIVIASYRASMPLSPPAQAHPRYLVDSTAASQHHCHSTPTHAHTLASTRQQVPQLVRHGRVEVKYAPGRQPAHADVPVDGARFLSSNPACTVGDAKMQVWFLFLLLVMSCSS